MYDYYSLLNYDIATPPDYQPKGFMHARSELFSYRLREKEQTTFNIGNVTSV